MRVGFGGYRISSRSKEHKEALELALDLGCSVIDTSSNYTDGESEELIGQVLKTREKKPLVITKAGYIQGQNLKHFQELQDIEEIEFADFSEDLKHSIDPVFLRDQLERSLQRLDVEQIDALLLHNPEYFLKKDPGNEDEYYRRIQKAFEYLKQEVSQGRIKSFGISSNTFTSPQDSKEATSLDKVWEAAKKAGAQEGFKYIQFPMNLLEMDALKREDGGLNLIEKAKGLGLTTIGNRPLNAFSSSGLLRLATYPVDAQKLKDPEALFAQKLGALDKKWKEVLEDQEDELFDLPLIKQISEIWNKQTSLDAVQQIFMGHFFPLVAQIYGKDLSPEESGPFYELYETALEFAKKNMNERAEKFILQAQESGLLEPSSKTLSQRAIEKYQETGIDIVLVGMKSTKYVEDLKEYF
ncbi:MAG: aldo/keto reductase [Bacteriovoracaceae bacterium]